MKCCHVVLVDDDLDFLNVTRLILESEGFLVTPCSCSEKAFRMICKIEPDVVVLDHVMPDCNGLDILKKLRSCCATARIPALLLTACRDQNLAIRGFQAGLDDFVYKPINGAELALRIKAIWQRSRQIPSGFVKTDSVDSLLDQVLGELVCRSGKIYILQIQRYRLLSKSDSISLMGAYDELQRKLVRRLCDFFSRSYNVSISNLFSLKRRDGIVLLAFSPAAPSDVSVPDGIRRILGAANRRLRRLRVRPVFLASDQNGNLHDFPLPQFRVIDVELRYRSELTGRDLFQILALDLERIDAHEDLVQRVRL